MNTNFQKDWTSNCRVFKKKSKCKKRIVIISKLFSVKRNTEIKKFFA